MTSLFGQVVGVRAILGRETEREWRDTPSRSAIIRRWNRFERPDGHPAPGLVGGGR